MVQAMKDISEGIIELVKTVHTHLELIHAAVLQYQGYLQNNALICDHDPFVSLVDGYDRYAYFVGGSSLSE
jgi:hypothetical protein